MAKKPNIYFFRYRFQTLQQMIKTFSNVYFTDLEKSEYNEAVYGRSYSDQVTLNSVWDRLCSSFNIPFVYF